MRIIERIFSKNKSVNVQAKDTKKWALLKVNLNPWITEIHHSSVNIISLEKKFKFVPN